MNVFFLFLECLKLVFFSNLSQNIKIFFTFLEKKQKLCKYKKCQKPNKWIFILSHSQMKNWSSMLRYQWFFEIFAQIIGKCHLLSTFFLIFYSSGYMLGNYCNFDQEEEIKNIIFWVVIVLVWFYSWKIE